MAAVLEERVAPPAAKREIVIDFMHLDLKTSIRCLGTDANLEAALAEVQRVLDAGGPVSDHRPPAAGCGPSACGCAPDDARSTGSATAGAVSR